MQSICLDQTWGDYITNVSITITNDQNHNVIDYDYIESNHNHNRDYICLETFLE